MLRIAVPKHFRKLSALRRAFPGHLLGQVGAHLQPVHVHEDLGSQRIELGRIESIALKQLRRLIIVFLAVVDYITGVIKGIYTKKLSSETGFKGLLKKIVMFIVIAVSFSIQELIGNTIPLREVVIMFYICNEALSLLENAAVFVPIPDKLKDVLIQLRDKDTEEDTEGE